MRAALSSLAGGFRAPAAILLAAMLAGCIGERRITELTGGCPPGEDCSGVPVAVTGGHQFTSLTAGRFHTCGLTSAGEVWCWGLNTTGQLGSVTPDSVSGVPVKVGGTTTFVSISGGEFHNCGLGSDSGVYCWGNNSTQVLGGASADACGSFACSRTPIRAAGTATFASVDAGATHNCALDASGAARCWGYNVLGETGSSNFGTATASPVAVQGGNVFTKLSAGFRFNCGLDGSGAVYCWGYGEEGQLATLSIDPCLSATGAFHCAVIPVAGNTAVRFNEVVTGAAFGCGLSFQATIYCWGYNGEGQLGTGDVNASGEPIAVKTTGTWSALTAGYFHVCALRGDGSAYCWGVNNTAQLGDGSSVYAARTPQPVSGGKSFTQIVAGSNHTCGLVQDGTAWCWGTNDAKQLGGG